MHDLIEDLFMKNLGNPLLLERNDSAVFLLEGGRIAMTTDSYVVDPIFFPGGNIGSLAVHGTVNDLAMLGARPLYLTTGFILEEGLPFAELREIVRSMGEAAREAGVQVVGGRHESRPEGESRQVVYQHLGDRNSAAGNRYTRPERPGG